jgi:hypothetical protein
MNRIKNTIIGIILLLTLVSLKVNAQKLTFGCKAGFDLAYFTREITQDYPTSFNKINYQTIPSFDFGILLNYQILSRLQVQIEPGLTFKGAQIIDNKFHSRETFDLGYLNMPATIIIKPIKRINIETGVEFGYLTFKNNIEGSSITSNNGYTNFKNFETSRFFGFSINPFNKFYLTFRYTEALTPFLSTMNYSDPMAGPTHFNKYFNKYFSIGTRYFFVKNVSKFHPKNKMSNCILPDSKKKY